MQRVPLRHRDPLLGQNVAPANGNGASDPTVEDCLAVLEGAMRLEALSRSGTEPRPSKVEVALAIAAAMATCRLYVANARQRIRLH